MEVRSNAGQRNIGICHSMEGRSIAWQWYLFFYKHKNMRSHPCCHKQSHSCCHKQSQVQSVPWFWGLAKKSEKKAFLAMSKDMDSQFDYIILAGKANYSTNYSNVDKSLISLYI
jgi:hypothetical protein